MIGTCFCGALCAVRLRFVDTMGIFSMILIIASEKSVRVHRNLRGTAGEIHTNRMAFVEQTVFSTR